ncbi:protease inhibitor I42 family protein [Nonomuraea spiralis]|uniref:protease inhibitor I42 family protein n=1 Tax=Nonomuraea TaxID=83681 RepID=UPI00163CADDB|nr:protease inhibitor I42 family protein [Nonomuraea sp. WAC 01424]
MKRGRAVVAAFVLLTSALAAGCGSGSAVSDLGTVVKGAKGTTVRAELRPGQRFSLAVPDNPSVGDDWRLVAVPDAKVASYISEERQGTGEGPGSGGTAYFVFNTKNPGSAEITLRDCWRCGQGTTPPDEESRRQSGEAIFEITVR